MGEDFYELVGLGKGGAQDGGLERWKWYNESLSFIDGSCFFLDESGFHFLTMSGFFFGVPFLFAQTFLPSCAFRIQLMSSVAFFFFSL